MLVLASRTLRPARVRGARGAARTLDSPETAAPNPTDGCRPAHVAGTGPDKMAAVVPAFDTHAGDHPPARPKRSHLNVMIVIVVVAVVAGIVVVAYTSSPAPTSVAVVGDSITVAAQTDIAASLGGAYRPDIHAIWGQRIDQMLPTLAVVLHRHPSDVVVNLGSNDAIQAATHPDWQRAFDQMIAMLASTHCVVLTTVSTRLATSPASLRVAVDIDAAITSVRSARPTFHIVDWNAAVHAANGGALLTSDRIHPSPAGQLTLAALIRAALDHSCRRPSK